VSLPILSLRAHSIRPLEFKRRGRTYGSRASSTTSRYPATGAGMILKAFHIAHVAAQRIEGLRLVYGDGMIPAPCMTAWRLAKPVVPGSCKSRIAGASTRSSSEESGMRSPKSKTQSAGG